MPRRSRGLWALAIAGPLALVLVLLLGRLREPAPRQAPPVAATPAVWALPETEAERRALAQAHDPHEVEQLGDYYLGADRPFAAVWQFQEALSGEAARTAGAPMALTLRLAAALQQGRWYLPAGRLLEPLAVGAPGNETARQQLAAVYLATGRPERAVRLLISGAGGFPGSAGPTAAVARLLPAQLLELGKACQAAGMTATARQAYERAMWLSPHNPEAPFRLGRLLLRNGQAGKAAALFRLTCRLDPHDPRFPDYLGRALMRLGGTQNREDAGRSFTAATMMAPGYAPAHLQLGIFHEKEHRWREAGHAFLDALKLDPNNAEAHRRLGKLMGVLGEPARSHYHLGWAFVFEDQPQGAIGEFRAMAAADPTSVQAPLLISQGYTEMVHDRDTRAVDEVKDALQRHPRDSRLYGRLGSLYFLTHNLHGAAELCQEWLRFQPEAAEPRWLQGKVAVAEHRLDDGIRLMSQAAAKEPVNAEYAFDLGEALARRPSPENLRAAFLALDRAVSLAPGKPRYRYQLAVVLQRLGELEGARRQFLRVLDQEPYQVQAVNSLVQVAAALGRSGPARFWASLVPEIQDTVREETDFRRRVGQQPDNVEGHLRLAQVLLRQGALNKARSHLDWALRLSPHSALLREREAAVDRILDVLPFQDR